MKKFKVRTLSEVLRSDRGSTGNEDPDKPNEPDLSNYVSKEEYDKAIKTHESTVASLKKDLDAKKLELLDPEYLDWRESKVKKAVTKINSSNQSSEDRVTALEATIDELRENLNVTRQVAERLYFERELEQTKQSYSDFDEYKEDIEQILTASKVAMTYKQAYLMAKDARSQEDKKGTDGDSKKTPPSTEKPSKTIQAKALDKKDYKTEEEANAATLADMREKYPNLGDTI